MHLLLALLLLLLLGQTGQVDALGHRRTLACSQSAHPGSGERSTAKQQQQQRAG
jgi:hypothetical protein